MDFKPADIIKDLRNQHIEKPEYNPINRMLLLLFHLLSSNANFKGILIFILLFCYFNLFISFIYLINLFIYFWLCWVSVAACGLFPVAARGGHSSPWCTGLSLRWPLSLQSMGSRHAASVVATRGLSSCGLWAAELRPGSCSAPAWLLCGMWYLPGPGLEPVSPALGDGFSTTAPQGSPYLAIFITKFRDSGLFDILVVNLIDWYVL